MEHPIGKRFHARRCAPRPARSGHRDRFLFVDSISGLVVEYIVAIDVTRVRFPADARFWEAGRDAGAASRAKGRRRGQQASLV